MERVSKSGPMVLDMKVSGRIIKLMAKASFGMSMVMFSMENGKMTKPMVTEFTLMLMERSMKVTGKKTYSTETV
jgi:hypothetical protein